LDPGRLKAVVFFLGQGERMSKREGIFYLGIKGKDNIRRAIFGKLEGHCSYCVRPIDFKTFHIDHEIPVSKGGQDRFENLFPACPKCNLEKGDKTLSEWEMDNHWRHLYYEDGSRKPDLPDEE
jgi:CRISPR/Cas system Type II protein with McrA/HNH and RuvC-like nuclease domain